MPSSTVFTGVSFGATGTVVSELVFNTSLTGYQEVMSDPSYAGQSVVFTSVQIGNTGMNDEDMESSKPWLDAIICREVSPTVSNYRSLQPLPQFCAQHGIVAISEVDTRALTRRLREKGAMPGCLCTDPSIPTDQLLAKAKAWTLDGKDMISVVSTKAQYTWTQPTDAEWAFGPSGPKPGQAPFKVVAYDFGIKRNILRRLASHGSSITVVPATTSAEEVLKLQPEGIFLSNGPGDPSAVPYAVAACSTLLGRLPMFGICMGHQVLGQALGGRTYKMKFGHHAGNHPIRHLTDGRVEISAQNHNYAVDGSTLPKGVEVTHISLNDGSVAGLVWHDKKCMGIQYHPEAGPGPHDADVNFAPFVQWMAEARVKQGAGVSR